MPSFHLWTMPNLTRVGTSASSPLQDTARLYDMGLHTCEQECHHSTVSHITHQWLTFRIKFDNRGGLPPFNLSWFCLQFYIQVIDLCWLLFILLICIKTTLYFEFNLLNVSFLCKFNTKANFLNIFELERKWLNCLTSLQHVALLAIISAFKITNKYYIIMTNFFNTRLKMLQ